MRLPVSTSKPISPLFGPASVPGASVDLAPTARTLPPMIPQPKLVTLPDGRGVGVYEYLGSFKWRSHAPSNGGRRVILTLW